MLIQQFHNFNIKPSCKHKKINILMFSKDWVMLPQVLVMLNLLVTALL